MTDVFSPWFPSTTLHAICRSSQCCPNGLILALVVHQVPQGFPLSRFCPGSSGQATVHSASTIHGSIVLLVPDGRCFAGPTGSGFCVAPRTQPFGNAGIALWSAQGAFSRNCPINIFFEVNGCGVHCLFSMHAMHSLDFPLVCQSQTRGNFISNVSR